MAAWAERRPRPRRKECRDRLAISALRFVIGGWKYACHTIVYFLLYMLFIINYVMFILGSPNLSAITLLGMTHTCLF